MMHLPGYAARAVERLEQAGFETWAVGGCVRDALTGRQSADIDCEVYGLAPQALRSLAAEFGEVDESGARYGIFSLKGAGIDLAVPRLERRTGPKHGDFDVRLDPALPFVRAAARRDFTVNAILRDALTGEIVDPFGGQEDLRSGVLRCVGDPARRFAEDALRILRLLRFASVLGFSVEENTARAARERRDGLRAIAHERVYAELNKLLCGEHAAAVLLEYPDILGVVLPEILPCVGFDQRNIHHCYDLYTHIVLSVDSVAAEPVLRWTMLLHDIGKVNTFTEDERGQMHFYGHPKVSAAMAEDICTRLRMRKKDREDIVTLIAWHDRDIPVTEKGIGSAVRALGEENFRRLLAVKRADNRAQAPEYRWVCQKIDRAEEILEELLRKKQCLCLKDLAVNGNDLLALGYEGREIGAALEWLLEGVIAGEIDNKRDALLAALAKKDLLLP